MLAGLGDQLASVNLQLWEIEDEIRECERQACFDDRFVALDGLFINAMMNVRG